MKKIIFIFLISCVIISAKPAEAIWGMGDVTFDAGNAPNQVKTAIESTFQSFDAFKNTMKTFGLDKVAYAVAQKASEKMTMAIVNKINGGASGDKNPNYVTNFKQHFKDVALGQTKTYGYTLLNNTVNPFASSIGNSILDGVAGVLPSGLNNFTLDKSNVDWKTASNDLSSAGDQGLWFFSQLALPQNTPMGSSFIAQEELSRRVTEAKEMSSLEILTSSGFLPVKDTKNCVSGNIDTGRGNTINYEQDLAALNAKLDDVITRFEDATDPTEIDRLYREEDALEKQIADLENAGAGEKDFDVNVNVNCMITNPGRVVADLSKLALEEPIVRNRFADSMIKVVANSLTQITSAAINKGFASLKAKTSGGSSTAMGNTTAAGYYGGPRDVRTAQATGSFSQVPSIIIDLNKELNRSMDRIDVALGTIRESLDIMRSIPQVASDLDMCTPGPDIGYSQRFSDYIGYQTKSLQKAATRDNRRSGDEEEALVAIQSRTELAAQEMELMVNDPYRNMPGATQAMTSLKSITQKTGQFQQLLSRLVVLQSTLNTLSGINSRATTLSANYRVDPTMIASLSQAEQQILGNMRGLILLNKHWDQLTQDQKNALHSASRINFPQMTLLPDNDPTTPENERDLAMRDRVLAYQWDEWEGWMNADDIRRKEKQGIYVALGEVREDIPSETEVVRIESSRDQIKEDIINIGEQLDDCLLVRTIFVKALYGAPNLKYQTYKREFVDTRLVETPETELTVTDPNGLRDAAQRLATRFPVYTPQELASMKQTIARAIPEKTERLQEIFNRPSILDVTDAEIQSWNTGNVYDERYQVNPRNFGSLKSLLKLDSGGNLFCTLPEKHFLFDPYGAERWNRTPCSPVNLDLGGVFRSNRDIQRIVSGYEATDLIYNGGAGSENPIRRVRKDYMGIPLNWYFSSGINDYLRFDLNSF